MTTATNFYDALAPMFDVMTDWDARLAAEGPFLAAVLQEAGAQAVLDAACGSGGHALWLAQQAYRVAGADVSPLMIDLARRKAAEARLDVPFVVADLADLPPWPPSLPGKGEFGSPPLRGEGLGEGFDAVLCLGNSLPHLLTQADLVDALRGMADVLRPGGTLVLQNLNYDLRWQRRPRWFAAQGGVLDGQEVLVWRFADYDAPAGRKELIRSAVVLDVSQGRDLLAGGDPHDAAPAPVPGRPGRGVGRSRVHCGALVRAHGIAARAVRAGAVAGFGGGGTESAVP